MKQHRNSAQSPHQLARLSGFARAMRTHPTHSERVLWQALRRQQLGARFHRQALVLGCIVDFLAPARKLIVEVDGGYHDFAQRKRADARRDRRFLKAGYRVLRLPAALVLGDVQLAVARIRETLG